MLTTPNNSTASIPYLFERYGKYLAAPLSYNGIDALLRAADHLNMLEESDRERWNNTDITDSFTLDELRATANTIQAYLKEWWNSTPTSA